MPTSSARGAVTARPLNPIKQHRQKRGLAREDLAVLLDVSPNRVDQLERNFRPPRRRITEIARHLGLEPDALEQEFDAYQKQCRRFAAKRAGSENRTAIV
jgi:transcriptional regulator with XRE-family HTH domain